MAQIRGEMQGLDSKEHLAEEPEAEEGLLESLEKRTVDGPLQGVGGISPAGIYSGPTAVLQDWNSSLTARGHTLRERDLARPSWVKHSLLLALSPNFPSSLMCFHSPQPPGIQLHWPLHHS